MFFQKAALQLSQDPNYIICKNMKNSSEVQLEKFILKGLVEEWNLVCSVYSIETKGRFYCPLFSLSNSKTNLGLWNPSKYEISIQREFAFKESWEKIRLVLKHEMAHQYADMILKTQKGEGPHGKTFKKACEILRIPHGRSLDPEGLQLEKNSNDRVLTKIKKLLSLATSSNSNEAELAMEKAYKLMSKYNFDNNDLKDYSYLSMRIGKPGLRHYKEFYHLASFLSEFYFVYCIWVPYYIKEKGKTGRILEISGKSVNIEIASYVHDYILNYINRTWDEYSLGKKLGRYRKSDFAMGIIHGFSTKLRKNNQQPLNSSGNLPIVLKADPEISDFLRWYYPSIRRSSRKGSVAKEHYDEGVKKGREMIISRGINQKKNKRALLPH